MFKPFGRFKRLSRKKKILVIIIVIFVGLIGVKMISSQNGSNTYSTVQAEKRTIDEIVTETGSISANGRTDVYSPTNGIVERVSVQNGATVSVGQELFSIKSTATEQEKAQASANYLAAKSSLETAQATLHSLQAAMFDRWDTYKALAESDEYEYGDNSPRVDKRTLPEFLIVEKEWLAAESNYKKQQTVISQAQAAASSTYLAYQATQHAVVKATAPGVVSNISAGHGSTVKQNLSTGSTLPLAIITGDTSTEIVISLSENDITKIKDGQLASIEVNALHDKVFSGTVKRVDAVGQIIDRVNRYNVYIDVTDPDSLFRPGMKADVVITTNSIENALSVPNSAIKPYQGGKAVRVPDENNEVTYMPVKVGLKGKEYTQILEGIEEGQTVITSLSNDQIKRPGVFGN